MNTENKEISLTDAQLDIMIAQITEDMTKAAALQEQALNKRIYLQGQLELLEQLKNDRVLIKAPEEKKKK